MLVVGEREAEAGEPSVRSHAEGDLGAMALGGAGRARSAAERESDRVAWRPGPLRAILAPR